MKFSDNKAINFIIRIAIIYAMFQIQRMAWVYFENQFGFNLGMMREVIIFVITVGILVALDRYFDKRRQ